MSLRLEVIAESCGIYAYQSTIPVLQRQAAMFVAYLKFSTYSFLGWQGSYGSYVEVTIDIK